MKTCERCDIQSMCPAPGWFCVHQSFEYDDEVTVTPLAGWATCLVVEVNAVTSKIVRSHEGKRTLPAIYDDCEVRVVSEALTEFPYCDFKEMPNLVVPADEVESAKVTVKEMMQRRAERAERAAHKVADAELLGTSAAFAARLREGE